MGISKNRRAKMGIVDKDGQKDRSENKFKWENYHN